MWVNKKESVKLSRNLGVQTIASVTVSQQHLWIISR